MPPQLRSAEQLLAKLKTCARPVHIKNPHVFQRKIEQITSDGLNNLMAIIDFDYTLTRHSFEGKECWSTHGVLEDAMRGIGDLYQRSLELKAKYTAIEYCHIMSMEEKIPYMVEWWEKSHSLTVASRFKKSDIERYCREANVHLREKAAELVLSLDGHSIPVLLFSAGIQDIIECFLKQQMGSLPPSVHVISNKMNFDADGICVGFHQPLIHTFNKNSSVIRSKEGPFFTKLSHRNVNNVLLLGDSLGDVHMDVGLEREGVVLRIGFLNFGADRLLDKYMEAYDVVIVDDGQTMTVPFHILEHLLSSKA